jgi:hypothetical protein
MEATTTTIITTDQVVADVEEPDENLVAELEAITTITTITTIIIATVVQGEDVVQEDEDK